MPVPVPVLAQVALTGLDPVGIAWGTALLHAALGGVLMIFFVRTLAAAGHVPGAGWAALAAAGFLGPSLLLAALLGPELATLGAALFGAGLFVAVLRWRGAAGRRRPGPRSAGCCMRWRPTACWWWGSRSRGRSRR